MDNPLLVVEAGDGQLRLSAKALVRATVVWGILGTFVSFVLFWVFHDDDDLDHVNGYDQIPTFSWAGAYMPQSILFTLGLHALGFVGAVLFALVYDVFKKKVDADLAVEDKKRLHQLNFRAWILGEVACALVVLTGSFSVRETGLIHTTLALLMFLIAIAQIFLFSFAIAEKMSNVDRKSQLLRRWICWIFLAVTLALVFTAIIVGSSCKKDDCQHYVVHVASIVEYALVVTLLLYIALFEKDLDGSYVAIHPS